MCLLYKKIMIFKYNKIRITIIWGNKYVYAIDES